LATYKQQIRELKLIPLGGGCFELSINGDLIYSKLKTGKFPEEQWAVEAVGARLNKK
jgi:selenoprotein W-related protein